MIFVSGFAAQGRKPNDFEGEISFTLVTGQAHGGKMTWLKCLVIRSGMLCLSFKFGQNKAFQCHCLLQPQTACFSK